ncbi:hypothetical protein [Kribbella sp. NPDC051770]|uniref:hypothetical protein n=1 Tax=Kribbella sp. NPDC051770 TaxID=3155413 RepID=UPI003449F1E8
MGVDVLLVRRGKKRPILVEEVVADPQDIFSEACVTSCTPMLGRVKPYGSLVLTADEMSQFISEVEGVVRGLGSTVDRQVFDDVLRVARTCAADRATELHLEGD